MDYWEHFKKLKMVKGEKIVDFSKKSLEISNLEGVPLNNYILIFEDKESIDPTKRIEVFICASNLRFVLNEPDKGTQDREFSDLKGKRLLNYSNWHFDTTFRPIQVLDLIFEENLEMSIWYFQSIK